MKKNLTAVIVIVAVILLGLVTWWVVADKNDEASNSTNTSETSQKAETETKDKNEVERVTTVQYQGEDGKTALELLKENADDVKMNGEGEMAFVTAINGVDANPDTEFWSFKVNGEMANVGAGQYETKSTDTITWELTKIDPSMLEGSQE